MLYLEMLVDFFASPGHQKCVRYISSLVTYQRVLVKNVSEDKSSSVDICLETNFITKAAAPYQKALSTTGKREEICPRKSLFSVSSKPSKTPEAANDIPETGTNETTILGVASTRKRS